MAKDATPTPAPEAVADVPQLTLTEFCTQLSQSVKSPELIAGFEYTEKAAGTIKDTSEAFKARFDTFVNTPV